jgi:uncharacterized protein
MWVIGRSSFVGIFKGGEMSDRIAFDQAIKQGDLTAVQEMATRAPGLLRAAGDDEPSPLLLSLYHGRTAVTEWLLTQAIGPLTIWEAAAVGDEARLRAVLTQNPAMMDAHAPDGFTPLGLAAFFGRTAAVALLLEAGADPNVAAQNALRVRPIHSAAANRRPETALAIVGKLLARGADPNVTQQGGWTPLHQAADHGHVELVQLLLEHGAHRHSRSEDGRLPVEMARTKGFQETVLILEQTELTSE